MSSETGKSTEVPGRRALLRASATALGASVAWGSATAADSDSAAAADSAADPDFAADSASAAGLEPADGLAGAPTPRAPRFPLGPFEKSDANPVLRPDPSHDWESAYLYNPCAVVAGGRVALLYRAQNRKKTSSIGLAWSDDGVTFTRRSEPVLAPTEPYETPGGCEDPRVVEVGGTYYLTYTGYDGTHALLCLATSTDLIHWTKHGPLFPRRPDPGHDIEPWSKSGAVLTEPIDGWYWMYFGESDVFWARSKDLLTWEAGPVDDPVARPVHPWERSLIEPGPPPVRTADGHIVLVYNGRADGSGGYTEGQYSGGQLLIDPADPTRAVARLERPFIEPTSDDEQGGQVNHVVFSEGLIHFRGTWFLYYGMADSLLGAATWTPGE